MLRGSELFHRAGSACECLAVGVLRRRDLQAAMQIQFRSFGASPDEADEGLTPFEDRVYRHWLPPSGRVLLVGSGAGRDLLGLRRLGYDVTGVEQAPDLVEAARTHLNRHGIVAPVTAGFIEAVELDREYDAVVFSPSCYSNMRSAASRVAALARLRPHLSPGGRLVISYIRFASQHGVAVSLMRLAARLTAADWQPEPGDTFTLYRDTPGLLYFFHSFRPGEVSRECAAAGFRVLAEEFSANRSDCLVAEVDAESTSRSVDDHLTALSVMSNS